MIDFQALYAEALKETAEQLKSEIVNEGVIPKDQGTLETSHHVNHPEQKRSEIMVDVKCPLCQDTK